MNGSILSAYSGIKTHQFGIDALSNNIANINTTGYRKTTPEFKTLMSQHIGSVNAPTSNDVNVGVAAAGNAISTKSGNYRPSDGEFDMAYQGKGWFVVGKNSGGQLSITKDAAQLDGQNFFTRDGSFSRDSDGFLVNSSGFYVYGIDLARIKDGIFDGQMSADDEKKALLGSNLTPLKIPAELRMKPVATTELNLAINLNPAENPVPLANFLMENGALDPERLQNLDLNALFTHEKRPLNLEKNGEFKISLQKDEKNDENFLVPGEKREFSFRYGRDFKTFGELQNLLRENLGLNLELFYENPADPKAPLRFAITGTDGARLTIDGDFMSALGLNAAGLIDEKTHHSQPLYIGSFATGKEILDENGKKFLVESKFFLTQNSIAGQSWEARTVVKDGAGNIVTPEQKSSIAFKDGVPMGENLTLSVNGNDVAYSFLGSGEQKSTNFDDEESSVRAFHENGVGRGNFSDVKIDENGLIHLYFDNGQDRVFGRVGIAAFMNDQGLQNAGNNMFELTQKIGEDGQARVLSGAPILGWDEETGALKFGKVMHKFLEGSNTDATTALTDLILMQKGYMMASKAFSAGDDLMKEAINLKR